MPVQLECAFRPSPFLRRMVAQPFWMQDTFLSRVCGRVFLVPQAAEAVGESAPEITISHIIDRARAKFTGGKAGSGPVASGYELTASGASDGLLVDAWQAIATVMKPCKRQGRRLCGPECAAHVQCNVLDKEEMMGYLVADLLGCGLIPKASVRPVGEAARLRAVKIEPAIAASRRRSKAGAAGAEAELRRLRSNVVAQLPLPSQRQCAGAAAAKRKCELQHEPDEAVRLQAWCRRMGRDIEHVKRRRNAARLDRAVQARLWRPKTPEELESLRQSLARQQQDDNLCTCSRREFNRRICREGIPSWLCRVTRCYATAATGIPCEERSVCKPGEEYCTCMQGIEMWGDGMETGMSTNRRRPKREITGYLAEVPGWNWFGPPVPGGKCGSGFDPVRAGDSLTSYGLRLAQDIGGRAAMLGEHPNFGLPRP